MQPFLYAVALFKSILSNGGQGHRERNRPQLIVISERIIPNGKQANGQLCFFQSVVVLESTPANGGNDLRDGGVFDRPAGIKGTFPNLRSVVQNILVVFLRLLGWNLTGNDAAGYSFQVCRYHQVFKASAVSKCPNAQGSHRWRQNNILHPIVILKRRCPDFLHPHADDSISQTVTVGEGVLMNYIYRLRNANKTQGGAIIKCTGRNLRNAFR